jgi:hypothetical protein
VGLEEGNVKMAEEKRTEKNMEEDEDDEEGENYEDEEDEEEIPAPTHKFDSQTSNKSSAHPTASQPSTSKVPATNNPSPTATRLRDRTTTTDYHKLGNPDARRTAPSAAERERKRKAKQTKAANIRKEKALYSKVTIEEVEEDDYLPRNIEEAMAGTNSEQWRGAVLEELGMVEKMNTWDMEELPMGREAIGSRWVFTKKKDEKGKVIRFKARLVAQGFSQKPGMDYDLDGTYAPVMRLETLRVTIALSAINKWRSYQLDVKNAYLNGDIDEEIYMKQPPGFNDGSGRVCKLKTIALWTQASWKRVEPQVQRRYARPRLSPA